MGILPHSQRYKFTDLVIDRLAVDPNLHIYHYAPYEPTAVKRLAGRYLPVAKRRWTASLASWIYTAPYARAFELRELVSIKRLEPLYGFVREVDLRDAGTSIVEFETWLELGQGEEREELLTRIEEYNRDDCLSTMHLRNWLEEQRAKLEHELGRGLPRPSVPEPEETEDSEAQKAVNELVDSLTSGLPESIEQMGGIERGQPLLAQMARELKPWGAPARFVD